mmetsp:Transcript_18552/g.53490  ORF Transcript_18552/g.53490 Transcript_18552/m.53490 type:complete len:225 (+) Transcript_18552:2044-2718(+)
MDIRQTLLNGPLAAAWTRHSGVRGVAGEGVHRDPGPLMSRRGSVRLDKVRDTCRGRDGGQVRVNIVVGHLVRKVGSRRDVVQGVDQAIPRRVGNGGDEVVSGGRRRGIIRGGGSGSQCWQGLGPRYRWRSSWVTLIIQGAGPLVSARVFHDVKHDIHPLEAPREFIPHPHGRTQRLAEEPPKFLHPARVPLPPLQVSVWAYIEIVVRVPFRHDEIFRQRRLDVL